MIVDLTTVENSRLNIQNTLLPKTSRFWNAGAELSFRIADYTKIRRKYGKKAAERHVG